MYACQRTRHAQWCFLVWSNHKKEKGKETNVEEKGEEEEKEGEVEGVEKKQRKREEETPHLQCSQCSQDSEALPVAQWPECLIIC